MITLRNVLTACMLTTPLCVVAQDAAAPSAQHSEHAQHETPSGAAGDSLPTADMRGHMREIRDQMARIRGTRDAGERERLMHEHMESMQQHMQMMRSTSAENGMMGERVRGLEDRLASIEGLLEQLLEHQRLEETQNAASRRARDRATRR